MFVSDLKFGERYQALTAERLNLKDVCHSKGCFKPYDFISEGIKYEVKADRNVSKYKNFFIEYECNGKPSGINATECDYWIQVDARAAEAESVFYRIPIDVLRQAVTRPEVVIKRCGDGWRVRGYIVKQAWFEDYAIRA
jgi:hypothetical protein